MIAKDNSECISDPSSVTLMDPTRMLSLRVNYAHCGAGVTVQVMPTNITCFGGSSGALSFTASGGTGKGYTYKVCLLLFLVNLSDCLWRLTAQAREQQC